LSLKDFPNAPKVEEDGDTFEANAFKKARGIAQYTNKTVLADDSGLEVDALGGQPGVHSARFAGEYASDKENNAKLLRLMEGMLPEERTARFRCAIALVSPSGDERLVEGTCPGLVHR